MELKYSPAAPGVPSVAGTLFRFIPHVAPTVALFAGFVVPVILAKSLEIARRPTAVAVAPGHAGRLERDAERDGREAVGVLRVA